MTEILKSLNVFLFYRLVAFIICKNVYNESNVNLIPTISDSDTKCIIDILLTINDRHLKSVDVFTFVFFAVLSCSQYFYTFRSCLLFLLINNFNIWIFEYDYFNEWMLNRRKCLPRFISTISPSLSAFEFNTWRIPMFQIILFKYNYVFASSRRGELFESVEGKNTWVDNSPVYSIFEINK